MKVVQARLGHSSAKTTLDVYGHLFANEGTHPARSTPSSVRRVHQMCANGAV